MLAGARRSRASPGAGRVGRPRDDGVPRQSRRHRARAGPAGARRRVRRRGDPLGGAPGGALHRVPRRRDAPRERDVRRRPDGGLSAPDAPVAGLPPPVPRDAAEAGGGRRPRRRRPRRTSRHRVGRADAPAGPPGCPPRAHAGRDRGGGRAARGSAGGAAEQPSPRGGRRARDDGPRARLRAPRRQEPTLDAPAARPALPGADHHAGVRAGPGLHLPVRPARVHHPRRLRPRHRRVLRPARGRHRAGHGLHAHRLPGALGRGALARRRPRGGGPDAPGDSLDPPADRDRSAARARPRERDAAGDDREPRRLREPDPAGRRDAVPGDRGVPRDRGAVRPARGGGVRRRPARPGARPLPRPAPLAGGRVGRDRHRPALGRAARAASAGRRLVAHRPVRRLRRAERASLRFALPRRIRPRLGHRPPAHDDALPGHGDRGLARPPRHGPSGRHRRGARRACSAS